jgi:hypothetical protein
MPVQRTSVYADSDDLALIKEIGTGIRDDGVVPSNQAAGKPTPAEQRDDRPVLPQRSADETDAGWGERPEPDDDERLRQDRPPHWDGN